MKNNEIKYEVKSVFDTTIVPDNGLVTMAERLPASRNKRTAILATLFFGKSNDATTKITALICFAAFQLGYLPYRYSSAMAIEVC